MGKLSNSLWKECFIPDDQWEKLKSLAMPENWDYQNTPSEVNFPILRNYISFTYQRLVELHNLEKDKLWIIITENQVCFNTGLLTPNYEEIYMLWEINRKLGNLKWYSKGFFTEADFCILEFKELPIPAEYFSSVEDLIFDTRLKLIPNFAHILEDEENLKRIPIELRDKTNLASLLTAEIERLKKAIRANYKIAVPQFYAGHMQFLLPICLTDSTKPDIVLAVAKMNEHCYRGNTCLTIDMAYNNARLIAKPETNWLAR